MSLYVVEKRKLWGDYGSPLISGYIKREGPDSPLLLHRAGPFLPPISFPWSSTLGPRIVVSDSFRRDLDSENFPGIQYRLAVKDRIVKLPWHKWDLTAEEPKRYPRGGEPEEYVWNKPHDARTASQMSKAWELFPPIVPMKVERLKDTDGRYLDRFRAAQGDVELPPLFSNSEKWGKLIVGESAKAWLEERAGDWVTFCVVEIGD